MRSRGPLSTELSDLDWFRAFCEILTRDGSPTFSSVCALLGTPKADPPRECRGSLFLEPFDRRFSYVSINPDIDDPDSSLPLEHIGLTGPSFSLKVSDLLGLFPEYRLKPNTWDGGYQIFFHPVPARFEFTALAVWTDARDIADPKDLVVNNVSFKFGNALVEYRDGFTMRRG